MPRKESPARYAGGAELETGVSQARDSDGLSPDSGAEYAESGGCWWWRATGSRLSVAVAGRQQAPPQGDDLPDL